MVYPRRSAQIRGESFSKNKCDVGQPPTPHRFVGLSACLPAARERRDDGAGPTALPGSAAFTSTGYRRVILRITSLQPLRQPATQPAQDGLWRRPQCPGNRYALARVSEFPPATHPRELPVCHRRHRNHQSASVENCHVFAEPTLIRNVATRNRKTFPACAEAVDDRTSLWKAEEKCGGNRESGNKTVARVI